MRTAQSYRPKLADCHRPRHRGHRPRRGVVLPLSCWPVCAGCHALCVRRRLDPAAGIGALCPCRPVHAGGGLDAAHRRPCACRCFLCPGKPRTRALVDLVGASCFLLPFALVVAAGCRALRRRAPGPFSNARARPAACRSFICSRHDPAVRAADRPARHRAGDPRRAGAATDAAAAVRLSDGRNSRRFDGDRGLRAAARRLSGGADAGRRVAAFRRSAARRQA